MKKIFYSIVLIVSCIASAVAGAVYTGKIMSSIIEENDEEDRLQRLAYSQLLIEELDAKKFDSLRESIVGDITSSIFHAQPERAYAFKYQDACLIHRSIFEYRNEYPEKYIPEDELEKGVQKILEMWSEKECDVEPSA